MKLPRWLRWREPGELQEEIAAHLELEIQAQLDRGLEPAEARAAALRKFGNRTRVEEDAREADPLFTFETFAKDVLHGLRELRRNRAFTAAAVVSLALGIGANTLIFGLLNPALLKPLPYADADRLVAIWTADAQNPAVKGTSSVSTYFAFRDLTRSFETVGAFNGGGCGVRSLGAGRDGAPAERLFGQCFSPTLFTVLGVEPLLGRTFTAAEDQVENVAPVTLLSYGTWRRRFGGDPAIVGQTISLNQVPTTVIGVLPKDFSLFRDRNFAATRSSELDFFSPLEMTRTQVNSRVGGLTIVARLKPGVSARQAQAEADTIAAQLAVSDPERHRGLTALVEPLQRAAFGSYRSPLLILQGAVAFVLLIACANVAGLLLARTISRRTEIALRLALGADRGRIVRQLIAEGVPLALLGGAAGVALAWGGMELFRAMAPPDFPRLDQISLDLPVLGFTVLMVLATMVLFTIVPAVHASRRDSQQPLKDVSRTASGGARAHRLRGLLVMGQIGLALSLSIGAGLMIRSFSRAVSGDLGADPANLLTFDYRLPMNETVEAYGRYRGVGLWSVSPIPGEKFERVFEALRTLPGVDSAAAVDAQPFAAQNLEMPFFIEGRPSTQPSGEPAQQTAGYFAVTRDYFRTMRIPILSGRDFDSRDNASSAAVIAINETFARQYFPAGNPLGQRIRLDFVPNEIPREIVAVVGDTVTGPLQRRPAPALYLPHLQQSDKVTGPVWWLRSGMFFVVRTSSPPRAVLSRIRQTVAEVDPGTPVADVQTVDDIVDAQVRNMRLYMVLLVMFGIVALVLAATGIYGVVDYSVADRTREIGIRMALGARTRNIAGMVLRKASGMILAGLALGLAGTYVLSRSIQSVLFEVTPTDPLTYVAISALLLAIAVAACLVPTHRAASVNPSDALKYE